ncbi:response regulator [Microtetraspora sp. NBRC 16547]|uniref:ANTAR domain-containing response regulator n=1 Tax=Microtetraspora sp. NBRC 16547 TaxID=3030993 RepID=UPI0024A42AD9|nr:response regulator [Microtetraspora sp. NBRC 16547]GLW99759.1 hypothetical protein Misp02_38460 [Microtetraspora sp. NBRC 16547]
MAVRCVIVDDSDHFKVTARGLLQREGIDVVGVASTAADAVRRVDEFRPDLALVDVELGAESGFDVAVRLNGVADAPSVILVSTYSEKDLLELIVNSPAIAFLSKSDLSGQAIRDILRKAGDKDRREGGQSGTTAPTRVEEVQDGADAHDQPGAQAGA